MNPKQNFAKSITNSNVKAKAGNPVAKAQPGVASHNRNQQMLHGVKLPAAGQSQKSLALKAGKVDQLGLANTISFGVNKKSTQHLKGASFAGNQLQGSKNPPSASNSILQAANSTVRNAAAASNRQVVLPGQMKGPAPAGEFPAQDARSQISQISQTQTMKSPMQSTASKKEGQAKNCINKVYESSSKSLTQSCMKQIGKSLDYNSTQIYTIKKKEPGVGKGKMLSSTANVSGIGAAIPPFKETSASKGNQSEEDHHQQVIDYYDSADSANEGTNYNLAVEPDHRHPENYTPHVSARPEKFQVSQSQALSHNFQKKYSQNTQLSKKVGQSSKDTDSVGNDQTERGSGASIQKNANSSYNNYMLKQTKNTASKTMKNLSLDLTLASS